MEIIKKIKSIFWKINDILKSVLGPLLRLLLLLIFFTFLIAIILNFNPRTFLLIFGQYASLILSSWPAVIFILGCILLFDQHEAVTDLIDRIRQIDKNGIKIGKKQFQKQLSLQKDSKSPQEQLREEVASEPNTGNPELAMQLEKISKLYSFEYVHGRIFGSQIILLKTLDESGTGALSDADVESYCENVIRNIDNLASTMVPDFLFLTSRDYLSFMEQSGLIIKNTLGWEITELGREFMTYLKENNLINNSIFNYLKVL